MIQKYSRELSYIRGGSPEMTLSHDTPSSARPTAENIPPADQVASPAKTMQLLTDIKKFADEMAFCVKRMNDTGVLDDFIDSELTAIERVADIKRRLKYEPDQCTTFTTIHNSQLKTLINEVQFYNRVLNSVGIGAIPTKALRPVFLYVGSAPNHKWSIIAGMFPHAITIMVDPEEHLIKYDTGMRSRASPRNQYGRSDVLYLTACEGNKFNLAGRQINLAKMNGDRFTVFQTHRQSVPSADVIAILPRVLETCQGDGGLHINTIIIEDYFTADFARSLAPYVDFFISDIQTNINDRRDLFSDEIPSDLDVCWNNALMIEWIRILSPRFSMIKLRLPTFAKDDPFMSLHTHEPFAGTFSRVRDLVDFVGDYKARKVNFIEGDELLQAFAGVATGETRLVFGALRIIPIDHVARSERLFYYNLTQRQIGYHVGYNYDPVIGIDACGDCALMCKVFDAVGDGKKWMHNSIRIVRSLISGQHGMHRNAHRNRVHINDLQYTAAMNSIVDNQISTTWGFKSIDLSLEQLLTMHDMSADKLPAFMEWVVATFPEGHEKSIALKGNVPAAISPNE